LTDESLLPGRESIVVDPPEGAERGSAVLDWKDGKIVGLEVLSASFCLHADLLSKAERIA